ncbi:MAG: hypothetical protein J7L38_02265 [Thermoproteales archaeon]|nr:hypothetical protein [Thermoproteales archaeon]RLE67184.1 MAG: hypothetical protein DRJ47_00580 [Thermoprotei archaeon]
MELEYLIITLTILSSIPMLLSLLPSLKWVEDVDLNILVREILTANLSRRYFNRIPLQVSKPVVVGDGLIILRKPLGFWQTLYFNGTVGEEGHALTLPIKVREAVRLEGFLLVEVQKKGMEVTLRVVPP